MIFPPSPRPRRPRSTRVAGRRLGFEPLEPRTVLSGSGLVGQYFHNADFTGLAFERTEAVDFDWGTAAPAPGVQADTFSVRWTGQLEARFTETYTLRTFSDDGVRLWINGKAVIDNWTPHAAASDAVTLALVAGQRYDVRLEYFDGSGSARMQLQWMSPSQPLQAIPATSLYESPPGLRGEYADASGIRGVRVDPMVDFDWNAGPPTSGMAADGFHVSWTGFVRSDYSEAYTFSTLSDEGVRVWVGDELVIDHASPHLAGTAAGVKLLEAGKWYDIRVEYFDLTGDAEVALKWSSARQTGADVSEVITSEHLRAATPQYFTNPLGQGQDPWVIRWQDSYLLVRSSGARSVAIDQAQRLEDIHRDDPQSTSITVWTAPTGTSHSEQIWAPELHQINGKWYIYVAASDGANETHRMHVLERNDPNPMGPYVYKGELNTAGWAIDGTVLQWQGQLYFVWSGWPGTTNVQQNLYIAPMSDPLTISGSRVLLSSPASAWERHGLPINEGPQVLIHDGQLHIIFSGSGYWTQEYALGRLTYDGSGSLLSASNWVKASAPVFQKTAAVVGVGHASFTTSPDGTEDWIVYHSHPSPGGNPNLRVINIQPFAFDANGSPSFGTPAAPGSGMKLPSGLADAERPFLPGDFDANGSANAADLTSFNGQFGLALFPGSGADGSANGMVDGADFLVWQRQFGATAPPMAAARATAAEDLATLGAPPDVPTFQLDMAYTAAGSASGHRGRAPVARLPASSFVTRVARLADRSPTSAATSKPARFKVHPAPDLAAKQAAREALFSSGISDEGGDFERKS